MPKGLNKLDFQLNFSANTNEAKRELISLQKTLSDLTSSSIKGNHLPLTKDIADATEAVGSLKAALASATNLETGKLDLVKFSDSLRQSGLTIEDYRKHFANLGAEGTQAFNQVAHAITNAEIPLKRTNTLIDKM